MVAAPHAGAPESVAELEVDGLPIEAAWQDPKVVVIPNDDEATIEGWDIRPADQWTAEVLRTALGGVA